MIKPLELVVGTALFVATWEIIDPNLFYQVERGNETIECHRWIDFEEGPVYEALRVYSDKEVFLDSQNLKSERERIVQAIYTGICGRAYINGRITR